MKNLSLFLSVVLLLSLLPAAAFAAPEEFVIEDGVLLSYKGPGGDVVIPEGVREIGTSVFYDRQELTRVSFPDSLEQIGDMAFYHCTSLTELDIPGSVEEIKYEAFNGCTGLCQLTLGDGIKEIGDGAFEGCVNLTQVTIPGSVRWVKDQSFRDCAGLTSVTLCEGVEGVESQAFDCCIRLQEVNLPSTLNVINFDAFRASPWLREQGEFLIRNGVLLGYQGRDSDIVIPAGVTAIGAECFAGSRGLTSVTLPDGLERIGDRAFFNCKNLQTVTLPASVTEIGGLAFFLTPWQESQGDFAIANHILLAYQGKDKKVRIPDGVKAIAGYAFYREEAVQVQSVTIPDSVERIGDCAFAVCSRLEEVVLPEGLSDIGRHAFYDTPWLASLGDLAIVNGCLLAYTGPVGGNIVIPEGVHTVTGGALPGYSGIVSVTFPASVTKIGEGTEPFDSLASVYFAPVGSYAEDFLKEQGCNVKAVGTSLTGFSDVDNDAYCSAPVFWAVENGITKGTSETTFSPDQVCTKEQVITFLWRYYGSQETEDITTELPFTDVAPGDACYPAVLWAYDENILTDEDGPLFAPKAPCTRAQAMIYLWRQDSAPDWYELEEPIFSDVPLDAPFSDAVIWAVSSGITTGTSETTFSPYRPCTRGQVMTFLYRAVNWWYW